MAVDPTHSLKWIVFPLIIRAIGVISSILGRSRSRSGEVPDQVLRAHDAEEAMFRSYEVSSVNTIVLSFVLAIYYAGDWRLAMLTSIGVALAVAFNPLTSYFTSTKRKPVKEIVESTKTGLRRRSCPAVGRHGSSVWALLAIVISFIAALALYGGEMNATYVMYAIAMVGIGMLSHTGNNVAMDSYGPISDNANGIGEMAWHGMEDAERRRPPIMADLDAVGTRRRRSQGRGDRLGVIAAITLFATYFTDIGRVQMQLGVPADKLLGAIRISEVKCSSASCSRRASVLFSSLCIKAVSRAAGLIVEEVRRQFRIPGLMKVRSSRTTRRWSHLDHARRRNSSARHHLGVPADRHRLILQV